MTESKALTPIGEICMGLEKMSPKLAQALPPGMTKEKFIRTALQGIQTHRDKDKLASADRSTFYLAVQKAASDGLLLDGREATLVVFNSKQPNGSYKSEVQYLPMVQGLVRLARNSGEISTIESAVVFEKDQFDYVMGVDKAPKHTANWFSDSRGEPIGVWAVITLKTEEKIPVMLPKSKIDRIAKKSKNSFQYDCEKGDSWEEWWKKAAIKNALKYAPRTTDLDKALEHDNDAEFTEEDAPIIDIPVQEATEKPKRRKAVDVVKEEPEIAESEVVQEIIPPANEEDEVPI